MNRKGFTLIELLVVIAIIALLMGMLMPALNEARQLALRLVCSSNLSGIGKSMAIYSHENEDTWPRAGGPGSLWSTTGTIQKWFDPDWVQAFGAARGTGQATITSSLYLLVKYYSLKPEQFVCKGDGARVFKIGETRAGQQGAQLEDVWDFSGRGRGDATPYNPGELVSYAYHMPYEAPNPHQEPGQPGTTSFVVMDQFNPGTAVAADRNPHLDIKGDSMAPLDADQVSFAHQEKGQNVMFKDASVRFYKNTVEVGIGGDNIYTWGKANPEGGDAAGTPPTGNGDNSGPGGQEDAYLVSEKNEPKRVGGGR